MSEDQELWEKIGLHRALGGVFYRSVIQLIALIFMFLVGAVIIPTLAPYPDVQGYRGVVVQLMSLTFTLFDVGIASSLLRFIPEYRVKDLGRSLQYASFFIWFQAFTGVVQITFVGIWALFYLPYTNIAYVSWFILTYSLVQWPSSTSLFRDLLKSFQHHDKAQLIEIMQTALIEVGTQVSCILIFRQWGIANVQYGELMGITIGWVIGVYLDDLICMLIGAKWFSTILTSISNKKFSIIDIIKPNFSKDVVKESLVFGFQNMGASLMSSIQSTLLVWVWIEYLPAYAYYLGIVQLVKSLTMRSGNEMNTGLVPAITESYNNKKINLTRYYVANGIKYYFFFFVFMNVLNFAVFPKILGAVLEVTGEYFVIAAMVIPFEVIVWSFDPIKDLMRDIIKNTGHVTFFLVLTGLNVVIDIFSAFAFIFFLDVGWLTLIVYLLPGKIVILVICIVFVHKKIIKIEFPFWQCIGAPALSSVFYYLFSDYFTSYIAPIFLSLDVIGGAMIVLAISFLLIPFFLYMPLYALFGGFDVQGLKDFENAAKISGPSRGIVKPCYRLCAWLTKKNPFKLHGRFPINTDGVLEDISELMILKDGSV